MTVFGCIHGRFQPFHNGHFEYMNAAFSRCDHLLIGITQYERGLQDDRSPTHRLKTDSNPFSYWERVAIISRVIDVSFLEKPDYTIIPFPIHDPKQIKDFVPPKCTMVTTIFDQWNREKVSRLREHGFPVEILWEREQKEFEGESVRQALALNSAALHDMLPAGCFDAICNIMRERNSA